MFDYILGRTWKSFSEAKQLSDYQSQLDRLSGMMNSALLTNINHGMEKGFDNCTYLISPCKSFINPEILVVYIQNQHIMSKLDSSTLSPVPPRKASKVIDIPPPTKFFSGRSEDLNAIATAFELPKTSIELGRQRIFVLYGTGGMGKTQIALKFINAYLNRYAYISFSSHTF